MVVLENVLVGNIELKSVHGVWSNIWEATD